MPTLTVSPNPIVPGGHLNYAGAGFDPKRKVQVALDGVGWTTNTFRTSSSGTFADGILVSNTPKTQTLAARYVGSTTIVAQATVTVAEAVPPPVDPPPPTTLRVTTIAALLNAIRTNVPDITVANGTYRVSASHAQAADSLWMGGGAIAARTNPLVVRAETTGGVTLDGGGNQSWGGISFEDGGHHQTWDGFKFANGRPLETGVIMFGGYGLAPAHHITLRNITMLPSIAGPVVTNKDHCIYFSSDSPHDILIEDYTATPGANIQSALQFNHDPNVYNLTVRRMHVVGTQSTIIMYSGTVHDVLIEDVDIRDALYEPVNINACGANVVLRRVISQSGGKQPYYPSGKPAGLTLEQCSFT